MNLKLTCLTKRSTTPPSRQSDGTVAEMALPFWPISIHAINGATVQAMACPSHCQGIQRAVRHTSISKGHRLLRSK